MIPGVPRHGGALVPVIAILSLISILAVATLSLATRLEQGSGLALRDARLDAASAFGLGTVAASWRSRSLGALAVGATAAFDVTPPGALATRVSVTRLTSDVFWVAAEAVHADGSSRRENLVLRVRIPSLDSIPSLQVAGNVLLPENFTATRDAGCAAAGPDLRLERSATLASAVGALPTLTVSRARAGDPPFTLDLPSLSVDSLAASADVVLPALAESAATGGVVHALGDLTITGGVADGILIVDGTLTITGPLAYAGLVIVRGDLESSVSGLTFSGAFRVAGDVRLRGRTILRGTACGIQDVLTKSLIPRQVAGRRWGEMYK